MGKTSINEGVSGKPCLMTKILRLFFKHPISLSEFISCLPMAMPSSRHVPSSPAALSPKRVILARISLILKAFNEWIALRKHLEQKPGCFSPFSGFPSHFPSWDSRFSWTNVLKEKPWKGSTLGIAPGSAKPSNHMHWTIWGNVITNGYGPNDLCQCQVTIHYCHHRRWWCDSNQVYRVYFLYRKYIKHHSGNA